MSYLSSGDNRKPLIAMSTSDSEGSVGWEYGEIRA